MNGQVNDDNQIMSLAQEKRDDLELFKENVVYALKTAGNSLLHDLNFSLLEILESDKYFKVELEKALLANQEEIGATWLALDNNKAKPTVANWLNDFIKAGLIDRGLDFDKGQYFSQSKNFLQLNEEDKKIVTKLLDLYFQLKFYPDSLTILPLGDWYLIPYNHDLPDDRLIIIEDEEDKRQKISFENEDAKLQPTTDNNKILIDFYQKILTKFVGINSEKDALNKKTNGDIQKIIEELIAAINGKKLISVLAALEILAEKNNLDLLKKDIKLVTLFRQEKDLAPEFWQAGFNLKYLSVYLRWLLINKLGMNENDSAVFALRFANILRRNGDASFMKIAYGDAKNLVFQWQDRL